MRKKRLGRPQLGEEAQRKDKDRLVAWAGGGEAWETENAAVKGMGASLTVSHSLLQQVSPMQTGLTNRHLSRGQLTLAFLSSPFFFFILIYGSASICGECGCPWRPEKGVRLSGPGVTGNCELPT